MTSLSRSSILAPHARLVPCTRYRPSIFRYPHPQHLPVAFAHTSVKAGTARKNNENLHAIANTAWGKQPRPRKTSRKIDAIIRPEWHPTRTRKAYNAFEAERQPSRTRKAYNAFEAERHPAGTPEAHNALEKPGRKERHCKFCCAPLSRSNMKRVVWSSDYVPIYCSDKCSYRPKERGRFLVDLIGDMLLERLPNEANPIVFTSDLAERVKAIKAEKRLKFLSKSSTKEKELWAAARRMVYFGQAWNRGLLVKLVDKDGTPVLHSPYSWTDLRVGVQYVGKRADFEAMKDRRSREDADQPMGPGPHPSTDPQMQIQKRLDEYEAAKGRERWGLKERKREEAKGQKRWGPKSRPDEKSPLQFATENRTDGKSGRKFVSQVRMAEPKSGRGA